jgi:uncharacterized membrane protein HdeD (DUF308 family)
MNSINKDTIGSIISIVLGLWLVIRYKSLGSNAIYERQKSKYFKINVTEKTERNFQIMFLIGGIILILIGILTLLNVI